MKLKARGMSLLSVLIAVVILGIVLVGFLQLMSNALRAQKFAEMKGEFSDVKRGLGTAIKCTTSIPNPAVCDGATPVLLRDGSGQPITQALETSGVFAGSGKYGQYYVKSTCSNVDKTLTVRVARAAPDGTFALDPLTSRPFDFLRPPNPIFGVGSPMCSELLGASTGGQTCGANQVMIGIKTDGSLNCVSVVSVLPQTTCPSHRLLVGFNPDGSLNCAAPGTIFTVSHATLAIYNPGCSAAEMAINVGNYVAQCIVACNAWCVAQGWAGGTPVTDNPASMGVLCVGVP